ncbi:MAG: lysophospholipid acyltransferase family protein [Bacteroidales bacterium]|nr:lysophospholipid acyltransferase family protein [Bacteroidales bacterium]MCI7050437.1 lysophospholipid acyltransferase family protein [Bacteroidales bacterium]MDD6732756.1 lysophospholipid acyltransferase family protein [Bacteroidales bacterium]MDY4558628.1 lysophospholipid acyltransferase family protein [Alloprevotella sp.]
MFLIRLLSRLPLWWLYRLSDLLFPLVYYVVRYRRGVVRQNLLHSFPERSRHERLQIERRFYRFFCDYVVETIKLLTISREEMMRRMRFEGCEQMDAELEHRPFCFLMLGHYANWEWISTIAMSCQRPTSQLYTPLHNKAMDRLFYEMRSRFGGENISKYDALRRIISWKREGRRMLIGFIADQSPKPGNTHAWMTFLNQDTPLFTGAERIGKKVGAAACFASVTRPRRGYYVCRVEPLTHDISQFSDYEFTELYMRRLEQEIQAVPHLWLWTHRRWKHKREAEVPQAAKAD